MLKKIHNEWNKFYVAIYKKKKMAKIFNLWTVFLTVSQFRSKITDINFNVSILLQPMNQLSVELPSCNIRESPACPSCNSSCRSRRPSVPVLPCAVPDTPLQPRTMWQPLQNSSFVTLKFTLQTIFQTNVSMNCVWCNFFVVHTFNRVKCISSRLIKISSTHEI